MVVITKHRRNDDRSEIELDEAKVAKNGVSACRCCMSFRSSDTNSIIVDFSVVRRLI